MQSTISFTYQNPEASDFFAWWNPPLQFIQISAFWDDNKVAESIDAPATNLR